MEQIRYTKRICTDNEKIDRFLRETRVGTLSMCDKAGNPYAVPVNYIYRGGKFYIHGMGSGKKNDMLAANPAVCFSVFADYGTTVDPVPCKCDTCYLSAVIFGEAVLVQDVQEKTQALTWFLEKFAPGLFEPLAAQFVDQYRSAADNRATAVYRIDPVALTVKENPVDMENMFHVVKGLSDE